jgi:hypothetical protein
MPGTKKPRKPYRPRGIDGAARAIVGLTMAKVRACGITDTEAAALETAVLSGLEEMRKGTATPNEWNSVARGINHAWTLAKMGVGEEALPTITEAEAGMKRAEARYKATGRLVLDGNGLSAVRLALELWGQQLRMCTVGEVDRATRLVEQKYWEKQAS